MTGFSSHHEQRDRAGSALIAGLLLIAAVGAVLAGRDAVAQDRAAQPDVVATTEAARAESLKAATEARILMARHDMLGAMAAAYRALPEFKGGGWPDVPEVRQALVQAYGASHLVRAYDRKASAAVLSRDGKQIAMAVKDGVEIRSLDPDNRLFLLRQPAPSAAAADTPTDTNFLDIASDGRHVVAANMRDYWVWSLAGQNAVRSGNCGEWPTVEAARFVGQGEHVLIKCGSTLNILAASDLHSVLVLQDVQNFDVSRDGRLIATDKEVRSIRDGKVLLRLPASEVSPVPVAFSPDGRTLAVATGKTIAIWNVADAAPATPAPDPAKISPALTIDIQSPSVISWVAFAPDGKSLVTINGGEIRVWDAASGDLNAVWSDHRINSSAEWSTPDRAYVSGDGRWLLTASSWQEGMYTAKSTIWSLAHQDANPIRVTRGEAELRAAAFTDGAKPLFATVDKASARGGVFVWSAESNLQLHRWSDYVAGAFDFNPAAAASNDVLLVKSQDSSLTHCRLETFNCTPAPPFAPQSLDTVVTTPKGAAVLSLQGKALVATSVANGAVVWRREIGGNGSVDVKFEVFDRGAYVLATTGLGTPQPTPIVLRAADGVPARTLGDASSVTPLGGPVVVVAKRTNGFVLANLDTGRSTPLGLPGDNVGPVALSKDGARAAILTWFDEAAATARPGQFLSMVAVADGRVEYARRIDEAKWLYLRSISFSTDGRAVLLGDRIIDAKSGNRIAVLAADTDVPIHSSRYSPDGRLIFAHYDAGLAHTTSLRIFWAKDGTLLETFVSSVSLSEQFSQDGGAYVVQDDDGLGVFLSPNPEAISGRVRRLLESAGLLTAN